jgi:hypothetical protein
VTELLSFEDYVRRWAWSPSKGLKRGLRPTPTEVRDIRESFNGKPDLVNSYLTAVTGSDTVAEMWKDSAPTFVPDGVGRIIATPLMLRQRASAPDAAAWGRLTTNGWELRGSEALLSRRQARTFIEERVSGTFIESLMRAGITNVAELRELWVSGVSVEYLLTARSAL